MAPAPSFSRHLLQRQEAIMSSWVAAVLGNLEIQNCDGISTTQLRDHLPKLLDDLAARLDRQSHDADADAKAHGYFRWKQGYHLSEVLQELALLRGILIGEMAQHSASSEATLATSLTVHAFLDDIVRISTVRFAEQQQAELQTLSNSRLGLLHTISHEVRNAVNAIHLVLEFHRDSDGLADREQDTHTLRRTVSHLRDLLDNLLDFARLSEGETKAERAIVDPAELAGELEATYRHSCEEAGLRFGVEVDPTLEKVESDPLKLRQISSNLLSNALKYTPQGGIALRLRSLDATRWALEVADTGMGIEPEFQTRLFEEFYRAPGTEKIHGTGLGLAITKRLVELLGGTIRVESKAGAGSTFAAILPKRL